MKIAIVGTSKPLGTIRILQKLYVLLNSYDIKNDIIISGGAKGVDTLAIQQAEKIGFTCEVYSPTSQTKVEFFKRNQRIAEECDVLYCITNITYSEMCYHHGKIHQDHQKTAGCWTMNKAIELNKPCKLFVL